MRSPRPVRIQSVMLAVIGVIVLGLGGCRPRPEAVEVIQGFAKVSDYLWVLDESGLAKRLSAGLDQALAFGDPTESMGGPNGLAPGCTCVFAGGSSQPVFGRNFDWTTSPALLTFHRPATGYASISVYCMTGNSAGLPPGPVKSLTEEQRTILSRFARNGVYDGMNDQGLAIGMNAISDARYYVSRDPLLPDIGELGIMRRVLNEAATVREALDVFRSYNVVFDSPSPDIEPVKVHYLLADAQGNSAIVEFVDGKMVVLPGDGKSQVTTNFRIYGATDLALSGCPRYTKAQQTLAENNGTLSPDKMMRLLKDVSQSWAGGGTQWSVVYDMKAKQVEIVVNREFGARYRYGFAGK